MTSLTLTLLPVSSPIKDFLITFILILTHWQCQRVKVFVNNSIQRGKVIKRTEPLFNDISRFAQLAISKAIGPF